MEEANYSRRLIVWGKSTLKPKYLYRAWYSTRTEVEELIAHAGIDIGDTSIGMHIKRVQVPLVPVQRELGGAHVTALASRPKLIGGSRAGYTTDPIRKF